MFMKKKLTEVAVDSFTEYLQERLAKLRELDLDQDGRKDIDQIIEILQRCGDKAKTALQSTDFPKVAAGLESILDGMAMIRTSCDQEKLGAFFNEVSQASVKLGELGQLSVKYVKDKEERET